jgi:hypothetical protein
MQLRYPKTRSACDAGMMSRSRPVRPFTSLRPAEEKYYSVAEIAKLWGLSSDTVRKIFAKTLGVLKVGNKGRYVTLRIPARVLQLTTAKLSACRKEFKREREIKGKR